MAPKLLIILALLCSLSCIASAQVDDFAIFNGIFVFNTEEELNLEEEVSGFEEEFVLNGEVIIIDISPEEACFYDLACVRDLNFCNQEGCCFWKDCNDEGVCSLTAIC